MLEDIPHYILNSKIHSDKSDLDNEIKNKLNSHDVDIVILAGFMKKIGKNILKYYNNRILNIHPSLLPKYGGQGMYGIRVHEAVIKNKEVETGVMIHLVDEKYDNGKILNQIKIPVHKKDNPLILQERVLKVEHSFLIDTLLKISKKEILLS